MLAIQTKRCLSFLLALVMVFSMLPAQAFAAETEGHEHSHETDNTQQTLPQQSDSVEASPYAQVQDQINLILTTYLGSTTMAEEDVYHAVAEMDWETYQTARWEILLLSEDAIISQLTEAEGQTLLDNNATFCAFNDALEEKAAGESISTYASSGTLSVLEGKITIQWSSTGDNDSGVVNADGSVTITAQSKFLSPKTTTILIFNNTDTKALLSFDYSAANYDSFSLSAASGTHSATLEAGGSVTVTLTGKNAIGGSDASVVMTNFSLVEVSDTPDLTFEFNSALGSVTAAGKAVATGDVVTVSASEGVALAATANSGATFLGWIDDNGKILSTASSFTLYAVTHMTVKAVFVNSSSIAYFRVGSSYLFDDLNKAAGNAASGATKTIVLANDGILPAGNYTIPGGVTLLIPFDSADTCYVETPANVTSTTLPSPYAYRTLTIADGAHITVAGTMSVSAKQFAAGGGQRAAGTPGGAYGYVKMQGSSSITVSSGGALAVYGYISGSGSVTAKSGAKIYESFQFEDFRGGSQTSNMDNRVFVLSQYYVQNIEVPMTLEAGATEYSYASIEALNTGAGSSVAFISSSGAMFNLTSGSVTKYYDKATDRLIIEANGKMTIEPLSMRISIYSINSEDYVLPINGNMTVRIKSGSIALNQDISLLPGAEIIIEEGVTCSLGSGCSIFVYDADEWGNYAGAANAKLLPAYYVPERLYTRSERDLVDARITVYGTMDASAGYIHTTASGAEITGIPGAVAKIKASTQTVTYQLVQNTGYTEIPVTTAKLKNGDGSYTQTTSGTYIYHRNGKWILCSDYTYTGVVTTPADCENPGVMTYTCSCGGDSYTEVIPATGHTEEVMAAVAATCETTGLTEGKKCSVCQKILAEQSVIAALDHQWNAGVVTTAPTCTDDGVRTFTCQRTGCGKTRSESIAATGHSYTSVVTAPTCEDKGYTTHTCTCGDSYVDSYVDALGHKWNGGEVTKSPSCTEEGVRTFTCLHDASHTRTEKISALGHTPGDEVIENQTDAVCETAGSYDVVVYCSVCSAEISRETITVTAPGHRWNEGAITKEPTCSVDGIRTYTCEVCNNTRTEAVAATGHQYTETVTQPTCTERGYTTHTCDDCGDSYVDSYVSATGHSYVSSVTPATCTEEGYTTYTCEKCGDTYTADTVAAKGHDYHTVTVEATCTQDGSVTTTCSACEYHHVEFLKAKGHSYETTVTAPTCEDKGYTTHTCAACGDSYTSDEVAALGHKWDQGSVKTPATCTKNGVMLYTCSVCGNTKTEQISATNHENTTVVDPAVEATCTSTGLTEGSHCSACGMVLVAQQVIPMKDHAWDEGKITTAPTCLDDGIRTFTCPDCGASRKEAEPALGHDLITQTINPPTCTEPGTSAGSKCSRCDYTEDVTVIEPLGHNWVDQQIIKDSTCTEAGSKIVVCSRENCGATDTVVIEKKDHSYETVVTAPTCEEKGYTTHTCSACGDSYVTDEVDALGHDYETVVTAPTCTEKGFTTYTCAVCGDTYVDDEVDALGHKYNAVVTAPTCTEEGYTTYTCTVCGDTYVADKVSALGHDYQATVTAPTCTEDGYTTYTCANCGATYKEAGEKAVGHAWDEGRVTTQSTCTQEGVMTYTCANCGETKTETVNPKGHELSPVVTAPTCTEKGYTTYSCENCDYVRVGDYVDALDHDFAVTVTAPTCTTDGYTTHSCKRVGCGYSYVDSQIKAPGHDYQAVVTAPTCTGKGYTTYTCANCGDSYTADEVEAKGHNYQTVTVDATCTEDGFITTTCSDCDYKHVEVLKASGHDYKSVVTAPTCTEDGYTTYTCANCGDTYTADEVAAKGHDYQTVTVAATCTEDGHVTTTCSRCDYKHVEIQKASGHDYKSVVTAPTCTEDGYTTYTCSVCGDTYVDDEVEAKGHDYESVVTAPTCTEDGCTTHTCANCGHSYVTDVIKASGHNYTAVVTEATCASGGYTTHTCTNCGDSYVTDRTDALPHTEVIDEAVPATCLVAGLTEGKHCAVCNSVIVAQTEIPALGHELIHHEAKQPTFTGVGWEAYEECVRCPYTTYVEIPALGEPVIADYETFMENLALLEELAALYVKDNPGKDPLALVIKYIRTGVDRYNSGSWGIMAGYEDAGFAAYVRQMEDMYNAEAENEADMLMVSGLKNVENFYLANGDYVDFGHMFGTMDITYHNKTSVNHADVAGWAGDLVDLLDMADRHGVTGTLDEMIADISANYLCKDFDENDIFSQKDMYGDLDAYYVMQHLNGNNYESGMLYSIMSSYFTEALNDEARADFFLKNRLDGVSSRTAIREAVYREYSANRVVFTLEGTRDFTSSNLSDLRRASCYAFADYLCKLAGDYVEVNENVYYSVFSTETSVLAPGITQEINYAQSADNKQMVYYIATADLSRDDVHVYANYKDNDPTSWGLSRVEDQVAAAQAKYGDPASEHYIPNYNVIASINADGFNMSTGEPGGLLVMHGIEYHPVDSDGFFAILRDGTAIMGSQADYAIYKDQIQEAVGGFGTTLVKDGVIAITASSDYYNNRASRTAVGITRTGKVVFMVLDGRQEPFSCGGSMQEIAQIMLEAGCVHAINLDGGGSTTFVAKQEGADGVSVVNSPSDGFARSVSTSLMMVSTAPSSTAFDHAIVSADVDYLTIGSSVQITAAGVSATGNPAQIPEGAAWAVSDSGIGSISADGVFTALKNGEVEISLKLGDAVLGSKKLYVVVPDAVYFSKTHIDAVYGETIDLPVVALYNNRPVAINEKDLVITLSNETAGKIQGFTFTGDEASGIKNVVVTAALAADASINGSTTVVLYHQGEATFDFEQATGGDRQLAWDRKVSNSTTKDALTYTVVNPEEPMTTSYIFAIDMTQIPIPEQLEELTYMLPGADMEGASAWNFLLQLAERVSVLTQVNPTIQFDPNFDVDYSGVTLVNEYFILNGAELDEQTNTLTLSLSWKDQTAAIDPATANPICILSGIKATPKEDAAWDTRDRLEVVNSGQISYTIYLRANALYTFAQKEENQKLYGLKPFENEDVIIGGATEKGAYFGDIYKEFNDTYTLINAVKNGWVSEENGYAYYVDGERLTGIQEVDGYYYDFGEDGICIGQNKYTGLFEKNGKTYYAKSGLLATGWVTIDGRSYCFDETGAGYDGKVIFDEVELQFEDGLLIGGYTGFIKKTDGKYYHYVDGRMTYGWYQEGDNWYHFNTDTGAATTGTKVYPDDESKSKKAPYDFAEDGRLLIAYFNPGGFYYWAGLPVIDSWVQTGADRDPNAWYRTNYNGHYFTSSSGEPTIRIYVDGVVYTIDTSNGKLIKGSVVSENGQLYYYWAGKPRTDGWFQIDGDTYYAYEDGHLARGNVTIDGKDYMFDNGGVLITDGIIVIAKFNADHTLLTLNLANSENLTASRFAIWPVSTGQNGYLQWFKGEKTDEGMWTVTVPMCQFGIAGDYAVHVFGTENGTESRLITTYVHAPAAVGHGYTDSQDESCNYCGAVRQVEKEEIETVPMYRLYNPYTNEHLLTASESEKNQLVSAGWQLDGICWNAPKTGEPVYRLYNPYDDWHTYSMSQEEIDTLVALGWKVDGVVCCSASAEDGMPIYRLFNPYEQKNYHLLSASEDEVQWLVSLGWKREGIAWYGMAE